MEYLVSVTLNSYTWTSQPANQGILIGITELGTTYTLQLATHTSGTYPIITSLEEADGKETTGGTFATQIRGYYTNGSGTVIISVFPSDFNLNTDIKSLLVFAKASPSMLVSSGVTKVGTGGASNGAFTFGLSAIYQSTTVALVDDGFTYAVEEAYQQEERKLENAIEDLEEELVQIDTSSKQEKPFREENDFREIKAPLDQIWSTMDYENKADEIMKAMQNNLGELTPDMFKMFEQLLGFDFYDEIRKFIPNKPYLQHPKQDSTQAVLQAAYQLKPYLENLHKAFSAGAFGSGSELEANIGKAFGEHIEKDTPTYFLDAFTLSPKIVENIENYQYANDEIRKTIETELQRIFRLTPSERAFLAEAIKYQPYERYIGMGVDELKTKVKDDVKLQKEMYSKLGFDENMINFVRSTMGWSDYTATLKGLPDLIDSYRKDPSQFIKQKSIFEQLEAFKQPDSIISVISNPDDNDDGGDDYGDNYSGDDSYVNNDINLYYNPEVQFDSNALATVPSNDWKSYVVLTGLLAYQHSSKLQTPGNNTFQDVANMAMALVLTSAFNSTVSTVKDIVKENYTTDLDFQVQELVDNLINEPDNLLIIKPRSGQRLRAIFSSRDVKKSLKHFIKYKNLQPQYIFQASKVLALKQYLKHKYLQYKFGKTFPVEIYLPPGPIPQLKPLLQQARSLTETMTETKKERELFEQIDKIVSSGVKVPVAFAFDQAYQKRKKEFEGRQIDDIIYRASNKIINNDKFVPYGKRLYPFRNSNDFYTPKVKRQINQSDLMSPTRIYDYLSKYS